MRQYKTYNPYTHNGKDKVFPYSLGNFTKDEWVIGFRGYLMTKQLKRYDHGHSTLKPFIQFP